jgi:D-arabinose 1-dehydrogenase-like Zn-dependent alcohol dehydrogenase
MDCRGAEKGNLARELGAHHFIDSRAENPDNAHARTTHGHYIIRFTCQ